MLRPRENPVAACHSILLKHGKTYSTVVKTQIIAGVQKGAILVLWCSYRMPRVATRNHHSLYFVWYRFVANRPTVKCLARSYGCHMLIIMCILTNHPI